MAQDVEKENKEERRRASVRGGEKKTPDQGAEDRREMLPALTAEEKKLLSEWKGKEGRDIRFLKDVVEFGIHAGEVGKIEDINRNNGVITLRMEDGRHVRMIPEYMRETEKKSKGDEKSPEPKVMEQGKEELKEEKKEVSKEQDRSMEKDPFQDRPEERPERRQEKEREEKKEAPRIERQRERGRDGMGY